MVTDKDCLERTKKLTRHLVFSGWFRGEISWKKVLPGLILCPLLTVLGLNIILSVIVRIYNPRTLSQWGSAALGSGQCLTSWSALPVEYWVINHRSWRRPLDSRLTLFVQILSTDAINLVWCILSSSAVTGTGQAGSREKVGSLFLREHGHQIARHHSRV